MFSGFYEALNQRAAAVLPEGSHSPNGTPRASFTGDPSSPTSPPRNAINGSTDGSAGGAPAYSTYQRRSKPSLEDRLRASLAAKEQRRVVQEKERGGLPALPGMEERPETPSSSTTHAEHLMGDIDAKNIPLPVSPPVQAEEPAPSLQEVANMVLSPPLPPAEPPLSDSIPELRQIDPTPPALSSQVTQPPLQIPPTADPLSPKFPTTATDSNPVQELTLPTPSMSPSSEAPDPLTGSLMDLEREQQAAAAKARAARSPPPPTSPNPPHVSPTRHHASSRSFSGGRSTVPDGEPFIRLDSGSQLRPRGSLEQVLRGKDGNSLIEWLGIEGVEDAQELKEWIDATKKKTEITQQEINRLNGKLTQHDSRIEELRDMHRLESRSQSDLIESLRQKVVDAEGQVTTAQASLATERSLLAAERSTRESLITAERAKHSTGLADLDAFKTKLKDLEAENEKLKGIAKEEEEKRNKAITLLKIVKTKLIKAEKDRDDLQAQFNAVKDSGLAEGKKGEEEMKLLRNELDGVKGELERVRSEGSKEVERAREEARREVDKRRRDLEGEMASVRDAMERDLLARRGEWEIEGMAAKAAHQKEAASLNSRIASLTTSLSQLGSEKEQLFTDLQFRQSELESSRTELETIQAQFMESNYQLRERDEQLAMLQVELSEAQRSSSLSVPGRMDRSMSSGPSSAEVARLLKEAEARAESRVSDLRSRLKTIESERAEQEENWSRTLAARGEEIERLRGLLTFQEKEGTKIGDYKALREREVKELEERILGVEKEKAEERRRARELAVQLEVLKDGIENKDFEVDELKGRLEAANGQLDELRGKESQLKTTNKTLRDELRKVQSSAALLERQRNPGVGYWASNARSPLNGTASADSFGPASSSPDLSKFSSSARPSTPTSAVPTNGGKAASSTGSARSSMDVSGSVQGEEEVNLEYLRNVILQFLENEKMRPNLVRVLSVILRFTPQETRRLIAKV